MTAVRPRTRVKVCCISTVEEAATAVRLGADALGLVSAMPSGPGVIEEEEIAVIARSVPPGVATFLLTSATDAATIVVQQQRTGANTLQLVDAVAPSVYEQLRTALPGIALVQVIHVQGADAVEEARSVAPYVNAILLDSGRPSAAVRELGGTGRVHDWTVSRAVRDAVTAPVYLAGGLSEANVAEAVRRVEPFGLDLCSGVRTDGRLDEAKLTAFMRAVMTT